MLNSIAYLRIIGSIKNKPGRMEFRSYYACECKCLFKFKCVTITHGLNKFIYKLMNYKWIEENIDQ